MRIVTCAQMRELEKLAVAEGISSLRLMENAGSAAARCIRENTPVAGKRCTVLCGRGNNGGDGFVVARRLHDNGAQVAVILACGAPTTPEATEMYERLGALRQSVLPIEEERACADAVRECDVLVDAVFGTGFHGAPRGPLLASLFGQVNRSGAAVYALDMPSGADADSGAVEGECIAAGVTISFGAPKTGQFLSPAAGYCGRVVTVAIGLPEGSASGLSGPSVELLEEAGVAALIPRRRRDANKGSFGRVFCLCGSLGMAGAALLAAKGALRAGAGLVTLGVPEPVYLPVASNLTEALVYPLPATPAGAAAFSAWERVAELSAAANVLLVGCGLSRDEGTRALVHRLVREAPEGKTVILDADGINAFEGHIDVLRTSKASLILTPHPGEMARLCGKSIPEIQRTRLSTARGFAQSMGLTLVLKGAGTVVAARDGTAYVNPTGNPGMARGGSGDLLAGMVAALAAQGLADADAACAAVYIHGAAGDRCAERLSQTGMLPSDMLLEVPQIFRALSR